MIAGFSLAWERGRWGQARRKTETQWRFRNTSFLPLCLPGSTSNNPTTCTLLLLDHGVSLSSSRISIPLPLELSPPQNLTMALPRLVVSSVHSSYKARLILGHREHPPPSTPLSARIPSCWASSHGIIDPPRCVPRHLNCEAFPPPRVDTTSRRRQERNPPQTPLQHPPGSHPTQRPIPRISLCPRAGRTIPLSKTSRTSPTCLTASSGTTSTSA